MVTVTEDLIRTLAPKEKTVADARKLVRDGSFQSLSRTHDGTLLWADCQGSALYHLSVDLSTARPVLRCTCPVKPPPCKHVLGLLALWLDRSEAFAAAEAPTDLLDKRARSQERQEKQVEAAVRPKAESQAAATRKAAQQREALSLLEKMVLDLVETGLGAVDKRRADRLVEQSRQMTDAFLPGAALALRRLAAGCVCDLPDAERQALVAQQVSRLWIMVRKGQQLLDQRLETGESESESDAVVEELLGRAWKLEELKARGYEREHLELLELAYQRHDDPIRQERVETGWHVELSDGTVYFTRTMRPLSALNRIKGQESHDRLVRVADAEVYPGFVNHRLRWEIGAQALQPIEPQHWTAMHSVALPVTDAVTRYKAQIKNPLAPDTAAFLIRVDDVAQPGISLREPVLSPYPHHVENYSLAAAGCAGGRPTSLLVSLWLHPTEYLIYGQPLALIVDQRHLRLGL